MTPIRQKVEKIVEMGGNVCKISSNRGGGIL
jgi:hypothetical protein